LIEVNGDGAKRLAGFAEAKLEGEERGCQFAGDGDGLAFEIGDFRGLASDDHRSVLIAHAAAATCEGITVCHVGIGVDRDRGNLQLAAASPLVESLDVLKDVLEPVWAGVQQVLGKPVEHEGVIGVWGMAEAEELFLHKIASGNQEGEV